MIDEGIINENFEHEIKKVDCLANLLKRTNHLLQQMIFFSPQMNSKFPAQKFNNQF